MKSNTGFGLDDSQQVSDVEVAVEFPLFVNGQRSSFRPLRQLQHSFPVALCEIHRQ